MKNVSISINLWRKLKQIRDEQGFKHFGKVIELLIIQSEDTVKNTDEKTIDVSPYTFNELQELKMKNSCESFDEVFIGMIEQLRKFQDIFGVSNDE